jgi:hypothetical protein
MRSRLVTGVLAVLLTAAGCKPEEAGIYVTVTGTAADIATLHVAVTAQAVGHLKEADLPPPDGESTITLPVTFSLLLEASRSHARDGALSGPFEVCVTARGPTGTDLAAGCATEVVSPGEVTEYTVGLGGPSGDAGGTASDAGADAGADGGSDTPTVPVLRKPMNGSHLGSVHAPGTLAPTFVWEPSVVASVASLSYELQYSTDPMFGAALTTTVPAAFPNHAVAADLPVAIVAPVGARYYWRVRACAGAPCSAYSEPWYVEMGRDAHDLNGDGYADVLVGAPLSDTAGASAGSVSVFLGGDVPDATPDTVIPGFVAGERFGGSVAFAGDVNADGCADALVGAPLNGGAASSAGRAYLFLGAPGAGLDATPDLTVDGTANDTLGGVAAAGDVNGDGYADFLVGAAGNVLSPSAGTAYVFFGGPGGAPDGTPDGVLIGETAGDNFGSALAAAGDLNGDGYGDVLVSAPNNDAGGTSAGRAYVYLGGPGTTFETTADAAITGGLGNDILGSGLAGGGDLNGDGFADFVVGARGADVGAILDAGRAYVYLGAAGATVDTVVDGTLSGAGVSDALGVSVAIPGDLNGDGFDDVVVGVPQSDAQGLDSGVARAFFGGGSATFDGSPDGTLNAGAAGDLLGNAVGTAGDVNGDGAADVIVGAPLSDAGAMDAGEVRLYLGGTGPGFDTTADQTFLGQAMADNFGSAIADAGTPPAASTVVLGLPPTRRRGPRSARRRAHA